MVTNLADALATYAASVRSLSNSVVELSHDSGVSAHLSQQLFEVAMDLRDQADAFEQMRSRHVRKARQVEDNPKDEVPTQPRG